MTQSTSEIYRALSHHRVIVIINCYQLYGIMVSKFIQKI